MLKHYLNSFIFILGILIALIFFRESEWFTTILWCLFAVFFIILSIGILFLRFNYFVPATYKLTNGKVLLTFDDGPDEVTTRKVLDVLKEHNVGAIFFVIGKKANQHHEVISEILEQGHVLGNHTYSHSNFFNLLGQSKVVGEVMECSKVISQQNHAPLELFRPPIGYTNPIIARAIKQINRKQKLKVIGWNFRSYDTVFRNSERLKQRMIKNVSPNQIILLHDNLSQTAKMLDGFIASAKKNGTIFVNQSEINTLF